MKPGKGVVDRPELLDRDLTHVYVVVRVVRNHRTGDVDPTSTLDRRPLEPIAVQVGGERLTWCRRRELADIEHGCDGGHDERGIAHRGQVDEEHPVGEGVDQLAGDAQGKPGLASCAGAGQAHQAGIGVPV